MPSDLLMMMTSMGFPEGKCRQALLACECNMERATDWLFSHMDDAEEDSQMAVEVDEYKCSLPAVYYLQSFVTHLGASVHAGHYVCHINTAKLPSHNWVYFNDSKVASTTEPPVGKGYIYFFNKV